MSNSGAWIRNVVAALESQSDEETCRRVLEPCGRRCLPTSLGKKARAMWEASPTARTFLERLKKASPHVTIVGEEIHVVYPECYCRQVNAVPMNEMPAAYCHCSVGWVKELFLQATGRDVDVVALTTIIRGGTECRFRVDLGVALDAPLR
jgi:hypothetical protein